MGKQGRVIQSQGSKLKRKQAPQTEATREKAVNDQAKIQWGKRKCEEIFEAIFQPSGQLEDEEVNMIDNDEQEQIEHVNHEIEGEDDDDNEPPEPLNLTQLISGDQYKHQRLREDAQWRDILQQVFIAFMQGSERTSNWGDDTLWCHNFNDDLECSCNGAQKKVRAVDTVDLIYRQKMNIEFCSCLPDQVRLINLGYLGGTPKTPETAFSLRLLRFYHLSWQYCHSNIQPFSLMIDKYLDAFNPPILVPGTYEPRLWRKPLTGAVICYRQILKAMEELETRSLSLSPMEKLAANCPRCFGPAGTFGIQKGPQYIVCVDGNFQQLWEPKTGQAEVSLDPCTTQHTAAADRRNGSSWKGCEETGLIAMVCRHDHMIKMVNVIRSGEK
ncbi:hypothetical protein DFH28DRAFT_904049 [Melampsora americana]|nr:hypothetical protein DFH28DRAFT_904049 [Melampsora americana]